MTPDKAHQLAWRWFVAGSLALLVAVGLEAAGFDFMPLRMASLLCLMVSAKHAGWEAGWTARDERRARLAAESTEDS